MTGMEIFGVVLTVCVGLIFAGMATLLIYTWRKRRSTWTLEGFKMRGPTVEGIQPVLGRIRYWSANFLNRAALSQLVLVRIALVDPKDVPDYRGKPAFETGRRELVGFKTPYTIYVPANEDAPELLAHAFGWHIIPGLLGQGYDVNHTNPARKDLVDTLRGRA